MTDEELKDFMKYFKDELPDPRASPTKDDMVNEMVSVNCFKE